MSKLRVSFSSESLLSRTSAWMSASETPPTALRLIVLSALVASSVANAAQGEPGDDDDRADGDAARAAVEEVEGEAGTTSTLTSERCSSLSKPARSAGRSTMTLLPVSISRSTTSALVRGSSLASLSAASCASAAELGQTALGPEENAERPLSGENVDEVMESERQSRGAKSAWHLAHVEQSALSVWRAARRSILVRHGALRASRERDGREAALCGSTCDAIERRSSLGRLRSDIYPSLLAGLLACWLAVWMVGSGDATGAQRSPCP